MPKIDNVKFKEKIEEIDKFIVEKNFFEAYNKCKAIEFDLLYGNDRSGKNGYFCFISTMKEMEVEQREQLIAILKRKAKIDLFYYHNPEEAKKYLRAILYINWLTPNSTILKSYGVNRSDKATETLFVSFLLSVTEGGGNITILENEIEEIKNIFS